MGGWYRLEGHRPVPCTVSEAMCGPERNVGKTVVSADVNVSTVFLGLDHRNFPDGPPVLFETMVFGGEFDKEQERYCTWDEAEAGHAKWVERATAALAGVIP